MGMEFRQQDVGNLVIVAQWRYRAILFDMLDRTENQYRVSYLIE